MKRANGEGSVFKLADGRWRAACPGGSPSFRGATRAEAMRKREVYLRTQGKIVVAGGRSSDSFAVLIAEWLDSKRASVRPRTIQSYHDTATKYIIPAIGDVPASKVTTADVVKAMDLAKSPRTKNYIRTVCHMALEYGVDTDAVSTNVARKVATVEAPETDREMPPEKRWRAFLGALAKEAPGTRALLLVIAFCGLRVGEACGLKWEDYDGTVLRVRRQWDREAGALTPVKTKAGRRNVPVGELAAEALKVWREKQGKMRERHARAWKDAEPDLMFTTRYGTAWNQRNVLRAAHRVSAAAGLGKRSVHYLRHVAISHLIADPEVDLKTVQTIAGHSSIRVTLDTYGHLIPGRLGKAAEAMNRRSVSAPEEGE